MPIESSGEAMRRLNPRMEAELDESRVEDFRRALESNQVEFFQPKIEEFESLDDAGRAQLPRLQQMLRCELAAAEAVRKK